MSQHRKTILFVVNDEWFFTSHRLPIAIAAAKAGYNLHLAARLDNTNEEVTSENIITHEWKLSPKSRSIFSEFQAIISLHKILNHVKPDIVHLVTIKSIIYGGLLARMHRISGVVLAVSGLGDVFSRSSIISKVIKFAVLAVYRAVLQHPNIHVIVQNEQDKKVFLELSNKNTINITKVPGSGVSLSEFQPTSLHFPTPVIMFASRLLIDKGILEFINAARALEIEIPTARFVIVGQADPENKRSLQEPQLREQIKNTKIEWWGHQRNMAQIISQATVIVLPTRYGEGVPKVLIEACASGKPIISSKNPGCIEIVKDGINGFTIDINDKYDLTNKIKILVENKSLCETLGKNARQIAEDRWSVDIVVENTLNIYKTLTLKPIAKPDIAEL